MAGVDTDTLFDHLVRNALDFLRRATRELRKQPKYSVVHFCTGLELLLKARLMREHWSLIVVRPENASASGFQAGNFQSVSIPQALERLENIAGQSFQKAEREAYEAVRHHRNQVVHFFLVKTASGSSSAELLQSIVAEQCRAWYYLDRRLHRTWLPEFKKHRRSIRSVGDQLHKNRSFLRVKFDELAPRIVDLSAQGVEFVACVSCGYVAAEATEEEEPFYRAPCWVCKASWRVLRPKCPDCGSYVIVRDAEGDTCGTCGTLINLSVLVDLYGPVEDPKEDSQRVYCDSCHYSSDPTVIPFGDRYRCLNCCASHDSIGQCGHCGERIAGIDPVESGLTGCLFCDGLLG